MVKNLPANAGDGRDAGLIPGSGRSPGGGHGNPLGYACLENPTDRGAWRAIVHRVAQTRTPLKRLSTHIPHMYRSCQNKHRQRQKLYRKRRELPLHSRTEADVVCCQLPRQKCRVHRVADGMPPHWGDPAPSGSHWRAVSSSWGLPLSFTTLDGGRVALSVVVAVQHFELHTKNGCNSKFCVLYTLP